MFCTSPESAPVVDVSAVQKSWSTIKTSLGDKGPETVGRLIFENLFKDYPETLNFFKNYGSNVEEVMSNKKFMWHAKERVFSTIDKLINSLSNQTELSNISSWLAKVHEPKGVKPTDFLNLVNAIMKTLEQALGNNFTPDLKASWSTMLINFMNSIGSNLPK